MTRVTRSVRGGAGRSTLTSALTATVPGDGGQFAVRSAIGWPSANFVVIVDRGSVSAAAEKILCSARSGNLCTVATAGRGFDGTTAAVHAVDAPVEHIDDALMWTALLEHVNTDAAKDHTGYVRVAAKGLVGDLDSVQVGDAVAAGGTGRWADGLHVHAFPQIPGFRLARSTTTAASPVPWQSAGYDSHTGWAVSPNPSRFTIPSGWGGLWAFTAGVEWAANVAGYREIQVFKNGTAVSWAQEAPVTAAAVNSVMNVACQLRVTAGDYLELAQTETSGAGLLVQPTFTFFAGYWVEP